MRNHNDRRYKQSLNYNEKLKMKPPPQNKQNTN